MFERDALPAPETDIHAAAMNRDVAQPAVPEMR
jgi:Derlin-2/3